MLQRASTNFHKAEMDPGKCQQIEHLSNVCKAIQIKVLHLWILWILWYLAIQHFTRRTTYLQLTFYDKCTGRV